MTPREQSPLTNWEKIYILCTDRSVIENEGDYEEVETETSEILKLINGQTCYIVETDSKTIGTSSISIQTITSATITTINNFITLSNPEQTIHIAFSDKRKPMKEMEKGEKITSTEIKVSFIDLSPQLPNSSKLTINLLEDEPKTDTPQVTFTHYKTINPDPNQVGINEYNENEYVVMSTNYDPFNSVEIPLQ